MGEDPNAVRPWTSAFPSLTHYISGTRGKLKWYQGQTAQSAAVIFWPCDSGTQVQVSWFYRPEEAHGGAGRDGLCAFHLSAWVPSTRPTPHNKTTFENLQKVPGEESILAGCAALGDGGRKAFHGDKELFASDHLDWVAADSIDGKCTVHSLKGYQRLDEIRANDYFSRFMYKAGAGPRGPRGRRAHVSVLASHLTRHRSPWGNRWNTTHPPVCLTECRV